MASQHALVRSINGRPHSQLLISSPGDGYCEFLINSGFGENCKDEVREFWRKTINENYRGDAGRRRARMAAINLRERDGLRGRLVDVRCPVLWLHETSDAVYSVGNAQEEIQLFVNARGGAKLVTIADGIFPLRIFTGIPPIFEPRG